MIIGIGCYSGRAILKKLYFVNSTNATILKVVNNNQLQISCVVLSVYSTHSETSLWVINKTDKKMTLLKLKWTYSFKGVDLINTYTNHNKYNNPYDNPTLLFTLSEYGSTRIINGEKEDKNEAIFRHQSDLKTKDLSKDDIVHAQVQLTYVTEKITNTVSGKFDMKCKEITKMVELP